MERGQLVPDDLTIRVVKERTAQDDCRNGYILDGFPRTPAQAVSLEKLAAEQGNEIVAIADRRAARLLEKADDGTTQLSGVRRNLQHLFQAAAER